MDSKVAIPTEKFEELVREATMCGEMIERIIFFENYITSLVKTGRTMVEVELCGAMLGFEVTKDAGE